MLLEKERNKQQLYTVFNDEDKRYVRGFRIMIGTSSLLRGLV